MEDFLTQHKFLKKNIKIIIKTCSALGFTDDEYENLKRTIEFLLLKGFSETAIARRIKDELQMAVMAVEDIKKRMHELKELKYENKDIVRMLQTNSRILTKPLEYITSMLDFLIEKNIKPKSAIDMTVRYSYLFDSTTFDIEKKLIEIEELGFSEEQALAIFEHHPAIIKKDQQFLIDAINDLLEMDFTIEEARHLISFSKVYLRGPKTVILKKIDLLLSLGLKNRLLTDPYALIFNLDSMYAKIEFLGKQGYTSPIHLDRYLFMAGSYFKNRFLVSPKEILVIYKASKELEVSRQKKKKKGQS